MDIFKGAGVVPLIEGVVGEGRDGLLATLGVTGSGKVRIFSFDYKISFFSKKKKKKHMMNTMKKREGEKKMSDILIEPYNPGLKISARSHPAFVGSSISIARYTNIASFDSSDLDLILECCRRFRRADFIGIELPRRCLWRRSSRPKQLACGHPDDGR